MKHLMYSIFKPVAALFYAAILLISMTDFYAAPANAAVYGDINDDGEIDIFDAMDLYRYTSGEDSLTTSQLAAADTNRDGTVDIFDAMELYKSASGEGTLPQTASYINEVVRLVNVERAAVGLDPLICDIVHQSLADTRAQEIVTSFSHTRPDGTSCFTVFNGSGINAFTRGENIAYGQRTPQAVVTAWMNSDGHRANILNENYTHIIVGFNNYHWVQLFYGVA